MQTATIHAKISRGSICHDLVLIHVARPDTELFLARDFPELRGLTKHGKGIQIQSIDIRSLEVERDHSNSLKDCYPTDLSMYCKGMENMPKLKIINKSRPYSGS